MTQPQDRRMRLGMVIASTREGRFGPTVARWFAKPIAFVSYGGLAGGLRAVEHLRLVFAEPHAVTIRETVSFHNAHGSFDADGKPLDKHGSQGAAAKMLHQLSWWARALLLARTSEPYPA